MTGLSADDYAATYSAALDAYGATRPRSMQRTLGVSAVGNCSHYAVLTLAGVDPTDAPTSRAALLGTSTHDMAAKARAAWSPSLLLEQRLTITLPSGLVIHGTADEVDPGEPSVTDLKTKAGEAELVALRRSGSTQQQQFQRHLYYLGALQAGLVPEVGTVRNVWVDRSGEASWCHVEQEPFSMDVVAQADRWLEDVVYAAKHGEDGTRDKHWGWCKTFCDRFTACRGDEQSPTVVVTDPELVAAAKHVLIGRHEKGVGDGLERAGKKVLEVLQTAPGDDVVTYEAGEFRVRWVWINRADGGGYHRLDVQMAATDETAAA